VIPRIKHSRSQLFSYWHDFEDGASVFGVSCDTYPDLFELAYPDIVKRSPLGWKRNAKGNCRYLWFPSNALDEDDIENLEDWKERFEQYVLIGINQNIEGHFEDELDFCMALDFNYNPGAGRTLYGEAEFQLKYRQSRQHVKVLSDGLIEALGDLPVPATAQNDLLVSYVPARTGGCNVPRKLAERVAKDLELDLLKAELIGAGTGLKDVSVDQKIPIWQELYDGGGVELSDSVQDKTIVVIDDLYQSGATLWSCATYLKQQGARYVFGLPCVKSLADTDNQ